MPPPPKKAPTKGAKQILVENEATISFYRNMAGASGLFYNSVMFGIYHDEVRSWLMFMNVFVLAIYLACYQLMRYISRPTYSELGLLIDPGLDLNMEGGMGEHIKDIVILTAIAHITAVMSNYFWLLLFLIPARAFWLIWKNLLAPWLFQEAPEDTEQDEKKRKKIERRMRRHQ
ncbi:transmembrane protein 208 [Pieris napi]|uniref:transmembrane protein 208 n=1 Tax=Pieris napi TaxID=78633 RepID=UPI001FBA53E6|nr:transmembrane protein 208 [Pieris napi]